MNGIIALKHGGVHGPLHGAGNQHIPKQRKTTQRKNTQSKKNIPSKKEWYQQKGDSSQHNLANENQRLIEKYAAKGKDFTKTDQYRQNQAYLDNVTVNRGGNRGRIYSNDPTLNTGNTIGDEYRKKILAGSGPANRYPLGAQGILNIDPVKARLGLENDPHSFFRFNQQLMEKNPDAYREARPVSSGTMAGKLATALSPFRYLAPLASSAKKGLEYLIPDGMQKDISFEVEKFKSQLPRFNNENDQLLDIQTEEREWNKPTPIQKKLQKDLQNKNVNWQDEILRRPGETDDSINMEGTVYDPTKDPPLETDENVSDWSDYTQKFQEQERGSGFDEEYEETREDIFDVPQNRMPHVPITREQKIKAVHEGHGWPYSDDKWIDEKKYDDKVVDWFYNRMREAQGKGMEYLPWDGVVADQWYDEWQPPGMSEIQDQIRWNTANQPIDWSGQPQELTKEVPQELTEDFIRDNIKTGSELWDFNQGGYLKKYDDGGYANMSTFEKLKAINDSIAEG